MKREKIVIETDTLYSYTEWLLSSLILRFHYIGSLFGPFRNDPSHFAVQWKQKCCWIDPERSLFPLGAIQ